MEYIIYFCMCICAVTVFAFYIRRIVNQYKKSKGITGPYRQEEVQIKTEFETEKFKGEVIECYYEMDEGSLIYLEAKIKRLTENKTL